MAYRWIRTVLLAVFALLGATLLQGQSVPVPTELVHRAMDQVLVEMDNPFLRVIKQGSWITNDNFRNPLTVVQGPNGLQMIKDASDFDARLFISIDGISKEQAQVAWENYQRRLVDKITAMTRTAGYSAEQTAKVLSSINLYPPTQAFKGFASNEEALEWFWKQKRYPNLGQTGEAGAEGLYTKATKFIRQRYEMNGRASVSALVIEEGGDVLTLVRRNNANLEHMLEGIASENFEGYVQATEYTLEQAQQAIKAGNLEVAAKNAERMTKYHAQARRLGGLKLDSRLGEELQKITAQLDALTQGAFSASMESKALLANTKKIPTAEAAKRAYVEFAALEGLSGKGAIQQRAFFKGLLEGDGQWLALRQDLELASERVIAVEGSAARLIMKNWVMGLFALWELKDLPEAIEKEGVAKATARMSMTIASLASVHVAIVDIAARAYMAVGQLLVDYVGSYGYGALVRQQDCNDLMAGMYTMRAGTQEDRTCPQIPDNRQLACRIYDQHGLRKDLQAGRKFRAELVPPMLSSLLACHAKAASRRWEMESKTDDGSEKALLAKCTPQVLRTWVEARQLVVNEIDAKRQFIEGQPLKVLANPARLKAKGLVHLTLQDTFDLKAAEKEISERAACMGGVHADPHFNRNYLWTVNGQRVAESSLAAPFDLNLTKPGQYEVCVTMRSDWRVDLKGMNKVSLEDGLEGRMTRRGCAFVSVDEPDEPPPPVVPPTSGANKPPGPMAPPSCSYDYSAWGECVRATKQQSRRVVAAKPAGCVATAQPVLQQGCTPPPSDEDKRNTYLNCLCRCSSGWAGHIGVWYDPEQKTVPECKSSGPCIGGIGAFGCSSRHFFNSSTECAKGCWEGAYGKGTYDAVKADRMAKDENRKFKKPPVVKITASKNPADFGDVVTLTADTTEGSGGYRWSWGGCAQDAKDNRATVLNSRTCQPCQAGVTVTDSDGDSASDTLTIQCTALRVKLTKESPKDNRVMVGGKATYLAEVFSGTQPAQGSFTFHWERNPDVLFGDPKNPAYETQGGSQSRNTATFGRLGNVPVWVAVLKDVGGRKMTMGESPQIVMEVVKPRLALSVEPREVGVGQEVVVKVREGPTMSDDMLSFWWEIAGEATNAGPMSNVPNSRAYSFRPKSDKPVTVTVHAKARDGGDEIGVERVTVQARRSTVTVTGPKIAGPAPMVWKEGVGLVAAGQQVAEGQRVEFAVSASPAPTQDLRYLWTIAPEGCTLSAPYSKETGVTCSRVGGYSLTAVVRNADGAELGTGNGSLSVTISQSDVGKAKQKDEAAKKLDQARQLWSQGKIDEALGVLQQATALDPAQAKPVAQQAHQALTKMGADALAKGDTATAVKRLQQAVALDPSDATAQQWLQRALAQQRQPAPVTPPPVTQPPAATAPVAPTTAPAPQPVAPTVNTATVRPGSSVKGIAAVPQTDSSRFKSRTVGSLHVNTQSFDPTPYLVANPFEATLQVGAGQSVVIAGDAQGRSNWQIDNFLLVEIDSNAGSSVFWAGSSEPVTRNGHAVPQRGSSGFSQPPIDITALVPKNVPVRVRLSAMDYGGIGYVSDIHLVVTAGPATAPTTAPAAAPTPAPTQPATTTGTRPNPVGTWRHSPEATWTITPAADGRWFAQETGLGNASGPAYLTSSGSLRIDYVTRDGSIKGYYEVALSADGQHANGIVQELNGPKRYGSSSWTRIAGAAAPAVPTAVPMTPTKDPVLFDNGNTAACTTSPRRPPRSRCPARPRSRRSRTTTGTTAVAPPGRAPSPCAMHPDGCTGPGKPPAAPARAALPTPCGPPARWRRCPPAATR